MKSESFVTTALLAGVTVLPSETQALTSSFFVVNDDTQQIQLSDEWALVASGTQAGTDPELREETIRFEAFDGTADELTGVLLDLGSDVFGSMSDSYTLLIELDGMTVASRFSNSIEDWVFQDLDLLGLGFDKSAFIGQPVDFELSILWDEIATNFRWDYTQETFFPDAPEGLLLTYNFERDAIIPTPGTLPLVATALAALAGVAATRRRNKNR